MQKISFRITHTSSRPGENVVDICLDGVTVGLIFADHQRPGIKIVSVHMTEKDVGPDFPGDVYKDDDGLRNLPHIPAVEITFKPSPWSLSSTGFVVRPNN